MKKILFILSLVALVVLMTSCHGVRPGAGDAYRLKMGLTPDQYIKLRSLEIEKEKVDMVRGKANVNVTMLMGNGATPIYNVK